ncbi:MAG TPA: two-component system regulatory protein YycI [Bacillota bacterium]|nr:two-component system regulatory protein YycI [Bacillota bacterium]
MQWNRIKNVFILVFLLLNIYLFYQYNEKLKQSDVPLLEPHESTIEHQLELEDINIVDLPDDDLKETYISVNQRTFTKEEFKEISDVDGQQMMLINRSFIVSLFEKSHPIHSSDTNEDFEKLLEDEIPFAEEYEYWSWNKEANVLIFFQNKKERSVYFNQNGVVLVYLNNKDEAVFYTQTMLGETEQRQEEKSLIEPIKAVEILYETNELNSGDDITNVNIGFHTRVPLDGEQVFVPTWKVVVNEERDYFVNAIEGFVFAGDELEFLRDAIGLYIERLEGVEEDKQVMKEFILEQLNEKLDMITGGE